MLIREADLIQDTQIHKNLQDCLSVATHRVRWGREQNLCLYSGNLKDPVEGLGLTVGSHTSLQEAKGSAPEG